jgi:colanic acid biosynthesis glycosyl transferase WcaI
MLASGRPVVATARSGTQIAACVHNRGLVVPPGDSAAMVSAICRLATDPDLRKQLGEAARKYAILHWDRDRLLQEFEQSLAEVCEKAQLYPTSGL